MSLRKKIIIAALLAAAAITGFGAYIKSVSAVPILMYHSVHPDAGSVNRLEVTAEVFERQMKFLKDRRYNVMPLAELAQLIAQKRKVPPHTVAVTFDDGYRNNYLYAFPILKKYGIPAAVFIITGEVGRPQGDRMTWDELREIQDSGLVTIGSHTLTHRLLTEIPPDEASREITEAKKILEEKLGREIAVFSYPEGRFNREVRRMVIDAGYKAAVATHPGRQYPDDDVFALKRLRISFQSNKLIAFWLKASGYYDFFKERKRRQS